MKITTRAKINLCLHVLRQRSDGYHAIRSIVVPIGLTDTLILRRARQDVDVEMVAHSVPGADCLEELPERENLAARAALALRREARQTCGVHIRIEKRIPIGAGLGGGSADAAAVLRGLNQLWNLGFSLRRLMRVGASVGADIPALLHGGPALIEGRGERVTPLQAGFGRRRPWWVVLANPGFAVSTQDIYARYRPAPFERRPLTSSHTRLNNVQTAVTQGDLDRAARNLFNDLERTVFAKYPLIEMIAEGLKQAGARGVLVTGSGSTVFGLAQDREEARRIQRQLTQRFKGPLWCRVVRILPDGVMVAHGPLEARV